MRKSLDICFVMLRLAQTALKTKRCAIVFVHMMYDIIQNGAENSDG